MDATGLIADVGRQSVRFGLTGGGGGLPPREVRSYRIAEHPTFTGVLLDYLRGVGLEGADLSSVLAVAGVARGDVVNVTGGRWFVSVRGVEAMLRGRCRAMNDFVANAYALPLLPASALVPLPGPAAKPIRPGGKYVLVGPGSGLGVAGLVTSSAGVLEGVESEAGHMPLLVETAEEARCRDLLAQRRLPLIAESVLSAKGLCHAYEAAGGRLAPGQLSEHIVRSVEHDRAARAAVDLLVGQLGAFVGAMVLAFGAWDGVVLTGGIARALRTQLGSPEFRRRMEGTGTYRRRLADVPVSLVQQRELELLGAAAALHACAASALRWETEARSIVGSA